MKKFASRVQRLNQRATDLRQALENAPPKIDRIRQAVTSAVGQVQKLRADIVTGVATLRSENDEQLVVMLREIDGATEVLEEAGAFLVGVEMDLGPNRRLIVHLERREDVGPTRLRALLNHHAAEPALKALLSALLHANELANTVELTHLNFHQLTVEVGFIPSVRVGWQSEVPDVPSLPETVNPSGTSAVAPSDATSMDVSNSPSAPPTSIFQRRATSTLSPSSGQPAATPPAASHAGTAAAISSAGESTPPAPRIPASSPTKDSRNQALERFKKMPDLTKRTR